MSMLKGLDRCQYVSSIVDEIDVLMWVKDDSDNIIFLNKAAKKFFKELSEDGEVRCPIDVNGIHENEEVQMAGRWLKFSSVHVDGIDKAPKGIFIIAKDVTKEKNEELETLKLLDEKIQNWERERNARAERIEVHNRVISEMLTSNGIGYNDYS